MDDADSQREAVASEKSGPTLGSPPPIPMHWGIPKSELALVTKQSPAAEPWVGKPPIKLIDRSTPAHSIQASYRNSIDSKHKYFPTFRLPNRRWKAFTERRYKTVDEASKKDYKDLEPFLPYIEKHTDDTMDSSLGYKTQRIQLGTVQSWLQTCTSLHGSVCYTRASEKDQSAWPFFLIDVEEGCLVSANISMRYVALSYVWGDSRSSACTTKSNIADLQKPGAFHSGTTPIPRTILDVMQLVHRLRERYLWVDRFCIAQDDSDTKQMQLAAMGEIYSGAVFTVIAAQTADASSGLYGERNVSDEIFGDLRQDVVRMTGRSIMRQQSIRLMYTKWFSRAWTFQEHVFSRRRIVFHGDTVNWECPCASWHETQDMPLVLSKGPQLAYATLNSDIVASSWPDMLRYARLVSLFLQRDLTFPEDVFDAFAGILNQLSRVFSGGFISGLPVLCFDAALLWQPWTPMIKRNGKTRSGTEAMLPSWSWAGWAGTLNSESWRSAADYQFEHGKAQQCSWKTFSTVIWSYSETLTSERVTIEVPSTSHLQNPNSAAENGLPHWCSASASTSRNSRQFFHSSDPKRPYRYPIPMCSPTALRQTMVNATYLHCSTVRGFLRFGAAKTSTSSRCSAVNLMTTWKRWAGCIRMNCKPSEVDAILAQLQQSHNGLCELIEISAGSVKNQEVEEQSFDEWNNPKCPRKKGLYEFVNVLWIEWIDGVAYRKALGRVRKNIWRKEAKEKIQLTLG